MECVSEIIKDFKQRSNRFLVLFALEYLGDGIEDYVNKKFAVFYEELQRRNQSFLQSKCLSPCSKSKLPPCDWCSTCATWRESIEKFHTDQRSINWSEIDSSKLSTDQLEVEKCFLPKCCLTSNRLVFPCNDVAATIGKIMNLENLYVEFSSTVKPQKIWKIRNHLANVTWISFAHKVELCDTIMTFLNTSPVYTRHSVARTSYNKIKILTEKSYDDITSGKHISMKEMNKLHQKVILKVSRSKIYMCVTGILILLVCNGLIANKAVTSELDITTNNVQYSDSK